MGVQEMARTQAVKKIIYAINAGQNKVRSNVSNECIEGIANGDEYSLALYESQIDQNIPFEQINGILASCNSIEEFAGQIAESDIPLYSLDDERIDQYALTDLCRNSRTIKLEEHLNGELNGAVVDIFAHVYGAHYQESIIPEIHRVGLERALGDSRFMLAFIKGQTEGMEQLPMVPDEEWNEFLRNNIQLAGVLLEKLGCTQEKDERASGDVNKTYTDERGV